LRRDPSVGFRVRSGRVRHQSREPELHPSFGRDLQRGDAPAQRLEIGVGGNLDLATQPAQRRHRSIGKLGSRSLDSRQFGAGEATAPAHPQPQAEEDQIDVAGRAILERDQRVGNAGAGIERQREPPEGLAGQIAVTRIPYHRRPVKLPRFVLYENRRSHHARSAALAMDLDVEALKAKLTALKIEHRDLDDVIARIAEARPFDQLLLQRLKKRKLLLKDQISKIESELLPDIIA
jgi:hypothetical protein